MTLYSRDVQTYCSLAHHIKRNQCLRGKHITDFTGEFTLKRYFYALRPILCIMWMEKHPYQLPPVVFQHLLTLDLDASLVAEIDTLLRLKAETREDYAYSSPLLDDFIRSWYEQGHALVWLFSTIIARHGRRDVIEEL